MTSPKPMDPHDAGDNSSVWTRAIRELAANPDSPTSLHIMSAVNRGLRPRADAADGLVRALAAALARPGPAALQAIDDARRHWERVFEEPLPADALAFYEGEARQLADRSRRGPPPIASIVAGVADRTDIGYDQGLHLVGLRGTWHRLWAAIALGVSFGPSEEQTACVAEVRAQLEQQLGRPLSEVEWLQLEAHARAHGSTISPGP